MRNYSTQMEAAKKGIITPEMKIIAEKEYIDAEELRGRLRKIKAILCALQQR